MTSFTIKRSVKMYFRKLFAQKFGIDMSRHGWPNSFTRLINVRKHFGTLAQKREVEEYFFYSSKIDAIAKMAKRKASVEAIASATGIKKNILQNALDESKNIRTRYYKMRKGSKAIKAKPRIRKPRKMHSLVKALGESADFHESSPTLRKKILEKAGKFLEAGKSNMDVAKYSGLSLGQVEKLRDYRIKKFVEGMRSGEYGTPSHRGHTPWQGPYSKKKQRHKPK